MEYQAIYFATVFVQAQWWCTAVTYIVCRLRKWDTLALEITDTSACKGVPTDGSIMVPSGFYCPASVFRNLLNQSDCSELVSLNEVSNTLEEHSEEIRAWEVKVTEGEVKKMVFS